MGCVRGLQKSGLKELHDPHTQSAQAIDFYFGCFSSVTWQRSVCDYVFCLWSDQLSKYCFFSLRTFLVLGFLTPTTNVAAVDRGRPWSDMDGSNKTLYFLSCHLYFQLIFMLRYLVSDNDIHGWWIYYFFLTIHHLPIRPSINFSIHLGSNVPLMWITLGLQLTLGCVGQNWSAWRGIPMQA